MQILKIVPGTKRPPDMNPRTKPGAGNTDDKIACMLSYLRSLECGAEIIHGDDDDWRYGRYLVHRVLIDALENGKLR